VAYHNRASAAIENEFVRVSVLQEGGHIAEILHKATSVNPLWIPPWPSIEPSTYSLGKHPEYGDNAESKLLSGIMGHNLALDTWGAPSPEEAKAGITVHGEASIARYQMSVTKGGANQILTASCQLPAAQLDFSRAITLTKNRVLVKETVENLSPLDRPIAWTQHVTLGPPFLERGRTQFRAPGTKSREMGTNLDFDWPYLPQKGGGRSDLQVYTSAASSGGVTTHLMDPHREQAYFIAWSPTSKVLIAYVWNRSDFPWLGIWEENHFRTAPPWNGHTLTRGMEFGASPMPESRRQMIDRHSLFSMPGYRWIPAKTKIQVDYWACIAAAESIPEGLEELQVHVPA
jgi:hypothetical protein